MCKKIIGVILCFLSSHSSVLASDVEGDPDEQFLLKILKETQIKKESLKDVLFYDSCPDVEDSERAITVTVDKTIATKDFTIPKDSLLQFCKGKLMRIDGQPSSLIEVLGRNCTVKVEYIAESKKYYCKSYDDLKIDGVTVPAGASIVFNRDKIFCFGVYNSNDPDSSNIPVVAGVKLKGPSYQIKNGKPVPSNCK